MLALNWQLSSFAISTAIHRSVGQLNAIQPAVDAKPHVVNVNEHLVVVTIDFDTIAQKEATKKYGIPLLQNLNLKFNLPFEI